VNVFDEKSLKSLFPELRVEKIAFVGKTRDRTNFLSAFLIDLAGNPWGTYEQEEACVHCGCAIGASRPRNLMQRLLGFIGYRLQKVQSLFLPEQPIWIHVLYSKAGDPGSL
jgi:hypothetical protein